MFLEEGLYLQSQATFEKKKYNLALEILSELQKTYDQLSKGDQAYPVVCSSSGKLLGEIDRSIVMQSMKSKV